MTTVFESVKEIFSQLVDDEPEPPINVGEVMDLWKYILFIDEAKVLEQIARNTTTDTELLNLIEDAIQICNSQTKRIKQLMEELGVPIPALPEDKPKSESSSIPMGVKLTDNEIAVMLAAKLLQSTKECSRSMMEAIRFDLGLMWANFFYEQSKLGAVLKSKMRKRGWIKYPPAYHPPGMPDQ
ncbi:DUF3231 family protein [Paenibacillus cremeus]|uniref:DUF3231 family protein n=1 Tax=Paenibacillus cremeus TaxID=2163881 RepID=A0A559K5G0_9BACL|nr:DUF3231 family protein [Paenibacillus cremeus]TVY07362.1 DUF3231 family protein [Paenibacillus cremeus]